MDMNSVDSKDIQHQEAPPMTVSKIDTDDDEILMWVDSPIVINIDSSDENSKNGGTETKVEPDILSNTSEHPVTHHVTPELNKEDAGEKSSNAANEGNFPSHKRVNQRSLRRSPTDLPEYNPTDKNVIADQCSVSHEKKRLTRTKSSSGCNRVSNKTNSDYTAETSDVDLAGHGDSLSSCRKKLRCDENRRRYHQSKSTADRVDCESSHRSTEEAARQRMLSSQFSVDFKGTTDYYQSGSTYGPTDYSKSGSTYAGHQDGVVGVKKTEAIETVYEGEESGSTYGPTDFYQNVSDIGERSGPSTFDSHGNESCHRLNKSKVSRFNPQTNNRSRSKLERKFLTTPPPLVDDSPPDCKQAHESSSTNNKIPETLACIEFSTLEDYARITIPKTSAQILMSNGYDFFNGAFRTHNVKVRMEWEESNDVLVVVGSKENQQRFNDDLLSFVEELKDHRRSLHVRNVLPKNKVKLIQALRKELGLLLQPLGDVDGLFEQMKKNDKIKTKNGNKIADRTRKRLNMILMGQTGLRDGHTHLAALERSLKDLMQHSDFVLTKEIFNKIHHHFTYIFSAYRHDNYPALIAEHHEFKKKNKFPALSLDPKFLI